MTFSMLCLCLLGATSATAQDAAPDLSTAGPQIDRGSAELSEVVRVKPDEVDRDFVNTALIFTNTARTVGYVRCVARNANGEVVGRAWSRVPRKGLRFLFASDFGEGADFVGSAKCQTNGGIAPTALLLGPAGVSDLPAHRIALDGPVGILFSVVATR
jgi:hypothetical protein